MYWGESSSCYHDMATQESKRNTLVTGLLHSSRVTEYWNIIWKISSIVEMTLYPMQRSELYTFLQTIPKGKVTTYGALAKRFGTSPRAIASMLHANRELDKYPCYKVIHTDGRIGWYRWCVDNKIKKLNNDGIDVLDWIVKKDYIFHYTIK